MSLELRLRHLLATGKLLPPHPGKGKTAERHRLLAEIGRQDLSLARLAEAHLDAVAILAEADRAPVSGALYGVWAADAPGIPLSLENSTLNGFKSFCTGAGLVDRALVTVTVPQQRLIDIDLRANPKAVTFDGSGWIATAFAETQTSSATFLNLPIAECDIIEGPGWYLERPGFWHGACGPAACWAGGAIGLIDLALQQTRKDPHTLAHLGAMKANGWALLSYLDTAGREIDADPLNREAALSRALTVRHLVEQACTDTLQRFARAYGPRPLAFDAKVLQRYQELDLYIRQSHAERDLESLGRAY